VSNENPPSVAPPACLLAGKPSDVAAEAGVPGGLCRRDSTRIGRLPLCRITDREVAPPSEAVTRYYPADCAGSRAACLEPVGQWAKSTARPPWLPERTRYTMLKRATQGLTQLPPNLPSTFPVCLGVVAQLVRASACHAEGRGFESRPSRHKTLISNALSKIHGLGSHLCVELGPRRGQANTPIAASEPDRRGGQLFTVIRPSVNSRLRRRVLSGSIHRSSKSRLPFAASPARV
jgi:hypothetical protein